MPPSVTVTGPLVADAGTTAVILESLHEEVPAVEPLNWTVLFPWVDPKPEPVNVTLPPVLAASGC